MKPQDAFKRVVAKAGSQARLGKLIGRRQSSVWHWRNSGIPAEEAIKIEKATKGEIPRWMCRPDLWEPPKEGVS